MFGWKLFVSLWLSKLSSKRKEVEHFLPIFTSWFTQNSLQGRSGLSKRACDSVRNCTRCACHTKNANYSRGFLLHLDLSSSTVLKKTCGSHYCKWKRFSSIPWWISCNYIIYNVEDVKELGYWQTVIFVLFPSKGCANSICAVEKMKERCL